MGAVPVLIMLAAVGVDYGWQPDGTTSPRGDNVEYIIQIPPQHLDQIRSAGEITSAIDPSIQGRVSRIVVKVGTGAVPKDGGRVTPAAEAARAGGAAASADDAAQIPIPEIAADALATNTGNRAAGPSSASLMKPDPQAGAFTMPEATGTPARTNPAVSTDPAAPRANNWSDLGGRAGATSPSAAAANSLATRPSTDPVDPAARAPMASGTAAPSATYSPPAGSVAGAAAPTGNRPTDPNDPGWSGYGTTPNFGSLPSGMTLPPDIVRPQPESQRATAANDFASGALEAQRRAGTSPAATSPGVARGLTRDAAGNLIDPLGRPVDSYGRVIDPETQHLVDAAGNWIDEYGRRIDLLGRPLSREPGSQQGPTGQANLQSPQPASQRFDAAAYPQPGGYVQQSQQGTGYDATMPYPPAAHQTAAAGDPRQSASSGNPRPPAGYDEDSFRSPSDTRVRPASRAEAPERENARDALAGNPGAAATKGSRAFAPDRFFGFLLIISIVANAYLIYETGTLRRKFRNMIANVRASKLSAPSTS